MSRYKLSEEATEDLVEIKAYLIEKGGNPLARYVLSALTEGFRFIANFPGVGHTREDLTAEPVRFWGVFSYLIVYHAIQPLTVVRILHSARDIEAIFERQPPVR